MVVRLGALAAARSSSIRSKQASDGTAAAFTRGIASELVFGRWLLRSSACSISSAGPPLHVQCSHPTRSLVKIITVYEPDAELWIDLRIRRTD